MRALFVILTFWLTTTLVWAEGEIRGNYEALNGVPKKQSLDKVQFEEFVNFGCPHCNHFRELSGDLKKQYKDRVEFVIVPVLFRGQNDDPLRLYFVAKSLGKGEQAKEELFNAKFNHGVDVFDPGIVNYLARSMGLGTEYQSEGKKEWVTAAIKEAEARAASYHVEATPTIVIAGTLKMNSGKSLEDFVKSLAQTLDDLLKPKS